MKHPFSRLFGLGEKTSEAEAEAEEGTVEHIEEFSGNEEVLQIPIEEIVPNRYQPRTVFIDERIEELSQTIKTHGIIQPIVVRRKEDQYEIIAGERRFRAVQKLGWSSIPAIVKEFNESQTASIALIENLQREELSAIEEATAYAKLIEIHGLTQESLAQRLGKGQSTIANKLRLLKLPQPVQNALLNKEITERHARALISLKEPERQEKVLSEIKERNLNVKQTEERIKQIIESEADGSDKKRRMKPKRKSVSKDTRLALNTIRQSIDMVHQTGLSIDTMEEDHEDYYEIKIRIPKK